MEQNQISTENRTIHWPQIISLAALNAVVVFSWIAYNNYQPKVLEKFDFKELAMFLAITQAIIMVCIPPVAGLLGDYMIRKNAKHFMVFTTGISMTAMVFMAVAFSVSGNLFEGWKNILPVLIVIWLISMNVFISPANSMIEMFAPARQLPVVMGIIVLITELISALEPIIINLVDLLGPTVTFVSGGILIAVAGYFFKVTTKDSSFERPVTKTQENSNYIPVILAGLLFGLITGILMNVFPDLLKLKLNNFSDTRLGGNYFVSIILALSALLALPLSKWVEKIGVKKGFSIGLIISSLCIVLIYITANSFVCLAGCTVLAASFSLTSVSAFPYAIHYLSARHVTFGTGVFFGATEVMDQLLGIFIN